MLNSCRSVLDNIALQTGENASLLLARYAKGFDEKKDSGTARQDTQNKKKKQEARLDLFEAMKAAAVNAYDLYSLAFDKRHDALKNIASSKNFETVGPLIAGLGNGNVLETGLALNPTYGLPMLPGSSIKGVTAHYCSKILGASDPDYKGPVFDNKGKVIQEAGKIYSALFGKIYPLEEQEAGYLRFFDAWIVPTKKKEQMGLVFLDDVMTPHNTSYYSSKDENKRPSEFEEPKPVRFLSVRGEFEFWISCLDDNPEQRKKWTDFAFNITKEALENFGIGGKLNAGYGKMKCLVSEEERQEQARQAKIQANREAGYLHDEGEEVQVLCKKLKIVKGKEKPDLIFVTGENDGHAIRFDPKPKFEEGATINAKILRIERQNKAYILQGI